jgi:uncharacterized membrane protein YfcA
MSVGSVSGLVYYNAGVVDTTSAAILASMATIMAPLGARATHAVDCRTLRLALGYWYVPVMLLPGRPHFTAAQNLIVRF